MIAMPAKKPASNTIAEIYALIDPRDGRIRYIGKANNALSRFKGHLSETRRKTPVYTWIAKLRRLGMFPQMRVIASCPYEDWQETERDEIRKARALYDDLLNVADGGNEPYCPSHIRAENGRKSAKKRTSDPLKERIYVLKRQLGRSLKDGYVMERTKQKMRLAAMMRPDLFGEYASL